MQGGNMEELDKSRDKAKLAYQNGIMTSAGPAQQIVLIYEGMVRTLQQLKESIAKNDIQARYNQLTIMATALLGLQHALKMDEGGEAARALFDFYEVMYIRTMRMHTNPNVADCDVTIGCLQNVLDGWRAVDKGLAQTNSTDGAAKMSQATA